MFGRVMQRQNSMPSAGIPVRLTSASALNNPRRMSHDVSSVKVTRPRSQQQRMSHPCQHPTGRLQSISGQSVTGTISFGYASNVNQYDHTPVTKTNSTTSNTTYAEDDQPSTSTFNSPPPPALPNQIDTGDDLQAVEFFIRLPDRQVLPLFCENLSGAEADLFLQSLPERQKERLKRFIEIEKPDQNEYYVWINDDTTNQISVISLKTMENFFRNQNVRRVKWRHVSLDKVSVYRYSVPVITTKFRLRFVSFFSRNYRCCILCVWCFVIFLISIGIVLTVVFGSAPQNTRFGNGTTAPRAGQPYSTNEVNAPINRNLTTASFLNYAHNGGMSLHGG